MECSAGAQDIANFEQVLSNGSLPTEASITHEGLFNEHYFAVGSEHEKPFSCQWSFAASPDPFSGKLEYFVGCGTRGRLDGDGIKKYGRPRLNLVIVLDISGSMSSPFGRGSTDSNPESPKNLLQVAQDCILALIGHLTPDDAFGLVAFDDRVDVIQHLEMVGTMNMGAFKDALLKLRPRNGTNMEAGIGGGTKLFLESKLRSSIHQTQDRQNRIMFLTDAQPNSGATSPKSLFGICKENAERQKIYTSFFGLGVDFGVELVDVISHIPACNYFTVKSSKDFTRLMDRDFDYVVTPSCFDVEVKIASSSSVSPERVYGSPGHEIPQQGVLMQMLSTFPSPKEEHGQTKGGMVIIKINPRLQPEGSEPSQQNLDVVVSYKDAQGKSYVDHNAVPLNFDTAKCEGKAYYSDSAIRKAILLVRFVNLMKWWIRDTRSGKADDVATASVSLGAGLPPIPVSASENRWSEMSVSAHYRSMFEKFLHHYERELEALAAGTEGGGETGDHERLVEHMQHLLALIKHISMQEINKHMLANLHSDEVFGGSVDGQELRKRVERSLGGTADLADKQEIFDREIKRRIKELLVVKLTDAVNAAGGKETVAKMDEATRISMAETTAQFAVARTDRAGRDEDWNAIARSELDKLLGLSWNYYF